MALNFFLFKNKFISIYKYIKWKAILTTFKDNKIVIFMKHNNNEILK